MVQVELEQLILSKYFDITGSIVAYNNLEEVIMDINMS